MSEAADNSGGLGGGSRDTRLIEKAIRQRWPISDVVRADLPAVLATIIADPEASPRNRIAAARALVSADALNMEQEKRDAGITDGSSVNVNVNVLPTPIIRIIQPATVLEAINHANGHT